MGREGGSGRSREGKGGMEKVEKGVKEEGYWGKGDKGSRSSLGGGFSMPFPLSSS